LSPVPTVESGAPTVESGLPTAAPRTQPVELSTHPAKVEWNGLNFRDVEENGCPTCGAPSQTYSQTYSQTHSKCHSKPQENTR